MPSTTKQKRSANELQAALAVIRILGPLGRQARWRVLDAVAVYYSLRMPKRD